MRAARAAIEARLGSGAQDVPLPESFDRKAGVFVSLNVDATGDLRGCIGYHEAYFPLRDALQRAAGAAATEDPRFLPVTPEELHKLRVEVSLLTPPEVLEAKDRDGLPDLVRVGEDGLIVSTDRARGLLLPQVPVEWGWDSREFLSQTCLKAGLPPDAWLRAETIVERFQAEIFAEAAPGGAVVRRDLEAPHARD